MSRFHRGDVVRAVRSLGCGTLDAIVIGSYGDLYGGDNHDSYSLMFCDDGSQEAWFDPPRLTFLRHEGESGIQRIIAEREARAVHERDLQWIAKHWATLRTSTPTETANELMRRVGIPEPWGSQGEGMAYHANWRQTFAALDPILSAMPSDPEMAILGIQLPAIDVRIG